jgi:hypothetical protein
MIIMTILTLVLLSLIPPGHSTEMALTPVIDETADLHTQIKNALFFDDNTIVGIETTTDTAESIENVFILNANSGDKIILDKPEVLNHRPIDALKQIDDSTFSYIITANPHFAQHIEYTTQGKFVTMYPIADECWYSDSFPRELQTKAKEKCDTNPEFGTFEDAMKKLTNK